MLLTLLIAVLGFVVIAGVGFALAGGSGSADAKTMKRAQAIVGGGEARELRKRPVAVQEQRRKQILKTLRDQDRQQKKAMFGRSNLENRLKAVSSRREELRRKSRESLAAKGGQSSLRHLDEGMYKRVVDHLQLSRLLEDPKVVEKLAQAGFRGPRPVSTFYFFRFVLPFAFGTIVAIYLFLINDFGLPTMQRIALSVAGLTLGYYAPNIFISNVAQKRRESVVGAFPDALDLLLICVESGMSIEAAIQKVSQEIGGSSIELAEELTLLTAEISYLPERRQAYEGLARRTNHPGIKSVTTAMIQAERYGTPLGSALRVMAKENRDMRLAAAEKTAAQLPAKLTVPMIVFFLPVLFIVILGPAVMTVIDMMASGGAPN